MSAVICVNWKRFWLCLTCGRDKLLSLNQISQFVLLKFILILIKFYSQFHAEDCREDISPKSFQSRINFATFSSQHSHQLQFTHTATPCRDKHLAIPAHCRAPDNLSNSLCLPTAVLSILYVLP